MKKSKICIGTSNFAKNYGINNNEFKKNDLKNLFRFLRTKKILFLDCADGYNNFKKFAYEIKKFKIIFKINFNKFDNLKDIKKLIIKNLLVSRTKKFEAVLIHNIQSTPQNKLISYISFLKEIKKLKLIRKIGLSIYNLNELYKIEKTKLDIDIIQFPLNIFDKSFINKKLVYKFKKKGTKFYARSIFLQGILLEDTNSLPKYFLKWKKIFKKWDYWHTKNNVDKLTSCINFIDSVRFIDKIIIGINDINQLKEILRVKKSKYPKKILSKNKKLIKPYLWNFKKNEK
tara:strand:- start:373 stop:1233 length:861 start_codon:yes stop_codon:yes gene_type:complete